MPVRLNGTGSSATEGFVEAFDTTKSQWSYICDNSFDVFDAHVICTMLGHTTAIEAIANSARFYGPASSDSFFTLDNLDCDGSETSVFDCELSSEITEHCDASKIAGIKCAKSKIQ